MFPWSSSVEDLLSRTKMARGGAVRRCLDQSLLMLCVHQWIPLLMESQTDGQWVEVETLGDGVKLEKVGHWDIPPHPLPPATSSLSFFLRFPISLSLFPAVLPLPVLPDWYEVNRFAQPQAPFTMSCLIVWSTVKSSDVWTCQPKYSFLFKSIY